MSQVILEALHAFFYSPAHTPLRCTCHAIQLSKFCPLFYQPKSAVKVHGHVLLSFIGTAAVRPEPRVSCPSPFSLPNIKTHAEPQFQIHSTRRLTRTPPDEKYQIRGYQVTCSPSLSPAHYQCPFNQAVDSLLCGCMERLRARMRK
jgi:hypothetical protein